MLQGVPDAWVDTQNPQLQKHLLPQTHVENHVTGEDILVFPVSKDPMICEEILDRISKESNKVENCEKAFESNVNSRTIQAEKNVHR